MVAVTCGSGHVDLGLTSRGTGVTGIAYIGHSGAATVNSTPLTTWITNASGTGLLAFRLTRDQLILPRSRAYEDKHERSRPLMHSRGCVTGVDP
ncbi:hypothetical protein ABIE67_000508 [Streptomyces sp. V4I8]|uniref:hypothetical protein n=1 Tax=Streptomyces sp. V4I8 TaxID=3156469 RepID=UPI00351303E2